jgi:hypothetical protein
MQMDPADIKCFPKFHYYVSINIPEVAKVGTIINAIAGLSGTTSKQTIKQALIWNCGPRIKIVKDLRGDDGKKAFGEFTMGANSQEIRIDKDLVREFERGKGLRKTPNGQLVYLVGVTLLHELTHWADDQDGVDDPIPGDPTNEEGEQFEIQVYGGIVE